MVLGYFLFDRRKNASRGARFDPQYGQALIEFTYEMMGYVARSAGRVNEEHIALANEYMNIMQLNEHMRSVARDAFKRGKSSSFDIDNCITNYRAVVGRNLELVTYLLEIQIQVALSDGVLTDNERTTLISMAVKLGVSAASMNSLIEKRYPHHGAVAFKHVGKALFDIFRMLGIETINYNQPAGVLYPTENPFS